MGRARAGFDGISSAQRQRIHRKRIDLKTLQKVNINEKLCICPFFKDHLSVDTKKSGPKEGDVCRGIDCYSYMA